MKAIMVMYDTLNRLMLEPYGCTWIRTPNFKRLAEHSVVFDRNYVGSMPCMPARRELHTGRYNFQHRSWGPLEPFDDSMPDLLKRNGIYTHICTDHQHYWEDGGASYLTRYNSAEFSRGQEGEGWKADGQLVREIQNTYQSAEFNPLELQDASNRRYIYCEERMPQAVTFTKGIEFIDKCHDEDRWFLTIETFDPHEPFYTQPFYKEGYRHEYDGNMNDWPPYYPVTEGESSVNHMRMEYAALISMCDMYLGKVLDKMDEYDLWKDTMLIVNTDHGYLLGEHGWWSKSLMPVYEEIAHIPLFLYDPRNGIKGERRGQLTQTIDIAPTMLDFFGVPIPKDMQGHPLNKVVEENTAIRETALFGYHEGHCNVTDGKWVYMKAPVDNDYYEYTLMPAHMRERFSPEEFCTMELAEPFTFTKECRTMRIKAQTPWVEAKNFGTKLFCVETDPAQKYPVDDIKKETELANKMLKMMRENDCPQERFRHFGFPAEGDVTEEEIKDLRAHEKSDWIPNDLKRYQWEPTAVNIYHALMRFGGEEIRQKCGDLIVDVVSGAKIAESDIKKVADMLTPDADKPMMHYLVQLYARTE